MNRSKLDVEMIIRIISREISIEEASNTMEISKDELIRSLDAFIAAGSASLASSAAPLSNGDELWNERILSDSQLPNIITNEYSRLYELWREEQFYGVLLQLKDLFEIILKLPVLLYIGILSDSNSQYSRDPLVQVGKKLLYKPPALSEWLSIAIELAAIPPVKADDDDQSLLQAILNDVIELYSNDGGLAIVQWRNEKIGHGALSSITEPFLQDLQQRIQYLTKHLTLFQDKYRKVEFSASDSEHSLTIMNRIITEQDYIKHSQQGLYFFDSVNSRNKSQSIYLNYSDGSKRKERSEQIHLLYEMVSQQLRANIAMSDNSIDQDYIIASREDTVFRSLAVKDYMEPLYLLNWIDQYTRQYSQGLLLLQMEEGMGKSTFVRGLDELVIGRHNKLSHEVTFRAYYANDSYRQRPQFFKSETIDTLRRMKLGDQWESLRGTVSFSNIENRRADFAQVLASYRRIYHERTGKDKLLFIIDGLDELTQLTGESIFDYIPRSDELSEGVYILLTARSGKELTKATLAKIDALHIHAEGRQEIAVSDPRYRQLIEQYLKQFVHHPERTSKLLLGLDYKFLYVQALKELGKDIPSVQQDQPLSPEQLISAYLTRLERLYGQKYFKHLGKLIAILSSCHEPLSLIEIVHLMGEDRIDLAHLSYLIDLRSWIRTERSARGNLYAISHDAIRSMFLKQASMRELMREMLPQWLSELTSLGDEEVMQHEAYLYIAAYWKQDAEKYGISLGAEMESLSDSYYKRLRPLGMHIFKQAKTRMEQERGIEVLKQLVQCGDSADQLLYTYCIAESYYVLAECETALDYAAKAKAIAYRTRTSADDYVKCLNLERLIYGHIPRKSSERRNNEEYDDLYARLYRKGTQSLHVLFRVRLSEMRKLHILSLEDLWRRCPIEEHEQLWHWSYLIQEAIAAFSANKLKACVTLIEQSLEQLHAAPFWPSLRLKRIELELQTYLVVAVNKIYWDSRQKLANRSVTAHGQNILVHSRESEESNNHYERYQKELNRYLDVFDAMWKNQAEGGFGDYLSIVVSHLEQSSSRGNVLEEILLRNRVRFFLQADEPSLRSDRLQAGLAQFMEKEEQLKALPRTGVAELIHYLRSVAGEDTNIPFANTDSFLVQYSRRAADLPKKDRLLWAYRLIVAKQTMIDCRREAIHEEWTRLIDEFVVEAQLQEGIPDKWIAIASFIRVLWATYTFKYAVADQEAARSQYHSTVLEGLACSFNGFKAEFDTIGIEDETLAFFSEFCKAVEAFKHVWLPVQLATHQHPLFEPEQMDEIIMRIGDK